MGLACFFGHKWNGCKCSVCGKVNESNHEWKISCRECLRCDRVTKRISVDCKCTGCSDKKITYNSYSGSYKAPEYPCERCSICGQTRSRPCLARLAGFGYTG